MSRAEAILMAELPQDSDSAVVKRLKGQGLLFDEKELAAHEKRQQKLRGGNSHKLHIKGYHLNSFPNRRERRLAAKRAGYFRAEADGSNSWGLYKAPNNVQTIVKPKDYSPAPVGQQRSVVKSGGLNAG